MLPFFNNTYGKHGVEYRGFWHTDEPMRPFTMNEGVAAFIYQSTTEIAKFSHAQPGNITSLVENMMTENYF